MKSKKPPPSPDILLILQDDLKTIKQSEESSRLCQGVPNLKTNYGFYCIMSSWHDRPRLATWGLCDFVWGQGKNKNQLCKNSPAQSVRCSTHFSSLQPPLRPFKAHQRQRPLLDPSPQTSLSREERTNQTTKNQLMARQLVLSAGQWR